MEILSWILDMEIFTLCTLDILNFIKLFVALFADTVNFLKTIVFIEGCYSGFLADIRPAFRPGLLLPNSKAILSSGLY